MNNYRARLGIDIDGTVTSPAALLPHLNEGFGLNLTLADIREYDLTKAVKVDHETFAKWWNTVENHVYATSPVHSNAQQILKQWQNQFELLYVSARGTDSYDTTKQWFEQHFIPYDDIHLIGSHYKIEKAKNLKVDAFFEDKHDNAVDIHEALDIPVLLFDSPWNQEPIPNGVIRVHNWTEANDWIQRNF